MALIPAFETKRLRVFLTDLVPMEDNDERMVFLATRTDEDRPMIAATAVVWEAAGWLDWLEVSTEHRRLGLGTELLSGIENYFKRPFELEAVTPEGQEFVRAYMKRTERT